MVVNYDESFNNNKKKSNYTSKTESTKLLKDSKYIENKNEFVSYLHNWLSMELAFHIIRCCYHINHIMYTFTYTLDHADSV